MNITIRGLQNEISCRQFGTETQAADLFNLIALENQLEMGSFKVVCEGNEISDALTFAENGLVDGSIVDLALEVDGGKKKKKKKIYKTEKKKKHKHINTKLRILSYYTIKSDGTVEPTKMVSPALKTEKKEIRYMANHYNRHYCGKTRVTLVKEKPDPIKKKAVAKTTEVKADAKKAAPAKGKAKKK